MSRLDFVTIAIVIICIAALAFLVYKTTQLLGDSEPAVEEPITRTQSPPNEDLYQPDSLDEAYYFEDRSETADTAAGGIADEPLVSDDQPDEAPDTYEDRPAPSGNYMVVAGSFRVRQNADNQVRRLRQMGYADAEVGMFNNGTYAAAIVDRFSSSARARELAAKLKREHQIEAYVQKQQGAN